MADDDVYDRFQCSDSFWRDTHVRLFFSDSGSILLGASRLLAFFVIFGLNYYNRTLLRSKAQDNMNVIPGIVLPYYFVYIYLYIGISLLAGVIDISLQGLGRGDSSDVNNWLIPLEQGIFHWLYEGLAFFLLRYGAGVKAFQRALLYSGIWGVFTFVLFFFLFSMYRGSFGMHQKSEHTVFGVFIAYSSVLLAFYSTFLCIPHKYLYRRSALDFYAIYNVVFYVFSIIVCALLYHEINSVVCGASVVLFLLVAITQPLVLYRTLQMDSQYWQGLKPEKGNPLAEVWDHVDVATAQSMAESVENLNVTSRALPVLHFGLLDFNKNEQFVAGGFSRVYFGRLRNEEVAFKILFAMELTPDDVRDFYQEASLLYSLRHENVVQCRGICVMPPALTMVLEHCQFGSLYDFLYKPLKEQFGNKVEQSLSTGGTLSDDMVTSPMATKPERIELVVRSSMSSMRNTTVDVGRNSAPMAEDLERQQQQQQQQQHHVAAGNSGKEIAPLDISRAKPQSASNSNAGNSSHRSSFLRSSLLSEHNYDGRSSDGRSSGAPSFSKSTFSDVDSDRRSRTSFAHVSSRVLRTYENITNLVTSSLNRIDPRSASSATSSNFGASSHHPLTAAQLIPFEVRLRMMRDAVNGIAFLHSKGFMHCDIKSLNFLVDANYRVKLADMGEVRSINGKEHYALPPIPARNWAPPEVIMPGAKADVYTVKSEVYGLCLVLCELIMLELPFGDLPERVTGKQWIDKLVTENVRPQLPTSVDPKLRSVIERGLHTEPNRRPDAVDVLLVIQELCNAADNVAAGHV